LTEYSAPILQKYSEKLWYKHRRIIIRKTKSKWGSCTHDQNISLNLSLVHLPTKYIRYVIIHEVCHLKIKNHSKRFWALVESFCPDYKNIRKEMRKMILK
jgi:predicted metal-dependent hydrolase